MTELLELTRDFKVSRPVFRLSQDDIDTRIEVSDRDPVYAYRPTVDPNNPLSELVCEYFRESFNIDKGVFTIDRDDIAERAMSHIRVAFSTFLEKHMAMKNPRQSKLYKWYNSNLPDNLYFNDKLVMVYKYMRTFCDKRMASKNQPHIDNTLALLEAIMEKYE